MSHQGEGTSEAIFFLFASIRTWGGLSLDTKHLVRGAVYPRIKTLRMRGGLSPEKKHFHV